MEDASKGADAEGMAGAWADKPWRKKQDSASDKTSELLSEKMLLGWALLEQCCPRYGLRRDELCCTACVLHVRGSKGHRQPDASSPRSL